jgi:type IV pilus assembly protein PilB
MRVSDSLLTKLLLDNSLSDSEKIDKLKDQAKAEKQSLQEVVIKNGLATEKDLTKLFAESIDIPFVDLNPKELSREQLLVIPERVARQYNVIYYGTDEKGAPLLAMEDPDDLVAVSFLQKKLGQNIHISIAAKSQILQALEQYRGNIGSELTKVVAESDAAADDTDDVDESEIAEDSAIAQTVNLIIEFAVKSGASDIHIEPRESFVSVRYRVDGILKEVNKLPKKVMAALVSRIKILSNLKIDERRMPQDGRIKISINGLVYALRVSTLPIMDGEKVVMRILNESSKALTLEELGYWGRALSTVNNAIKQPHGMILVTGPTGSGKSTSLFSVLSMLNRPDVNISTVEDPVEYRIPGVNQTQVNPIAGMTFVNGLRALLRQDPNIIMVGEIRDSETAGLGVQAALTGHLVFSTLHTNNAATCLPRLLDMNIEPFLIASTVRAVVGQRLVRRLCPDCREEIVPTKDEITQLEEIFHIGDKNIMTYVHELEKSALEGGIGKIADKPIPLSSTPTSVTKLYKAKDKGCENCGHNGYRGRMGIYEVLDNTIDIQKLIIANATSDTLQKQAVTEGMVTMQLDGFIKALRGQTSIEEILRVTSEN